MTPLNELEAAMDADPHLSSMTMERPPFSMPWGWFVFAAACVLAAVAVWVKS